MNDVLTTPDAPTHPLEPPAGSCDEDCDICDCPLSRCPGPEIDAWHRGYLNGVLAVKAGWE